MAHRWFRSLGLGVLGLLAVGVALYFWAGRKGSVQVEGWIRTYLVTLVQKHLNPTIQIGELDYQFPRTVVISTLRLSDSGTDILSIERLKIELAEIPRSSEPVLIERIEMTAPALQLIADTDGKLIGWSNLVRREVLRDPGSVEPGYRLSDSLRLRHAAISQASFTYVADASEPAMTFSGLDAQLDTPPVAEAPGSYKLLGRIERDKIGEIELAGQINLDTGQVDFSPLRLDVALDPADYDTFPPRLQQLLAAHQVAGRLNLELAGTWPLTGDGPRRANATATVSKAQFVYVGQTLKSDALQVSADLDEDQLAARVSGAALGGEFEAACKLDSTGAEPIALTARTQQIDLAGLILLLPDEARAALSQREIQGRITADAEVSIGPAPQRDVTADATIGLSAFSITIEQWTLASDALELKANARRGHIDAEVQSAKLAATHANHTISAESVEAKGALNLDSQELVIDGSARAWDGVVHAHAQRSLEPDSALELSLNMDSISLATAVNACAALLSAPTWDRLNGFAPAGRLSGNAQTTLEPAPSAGPPKFQANTTITGVSFQFADRLVHSAQMDVTAKGDAELLDVALKAPAIEARRADQTLRATNIDASLRLDQPTRRATVAANFSALEGTIRGRAHYDLRGASPLEVTLDVRSLSISQLLAAAAGKPLDTDATGHEIDGQFSGELSAQVPLADWRDTQGSIGGTVAALRGTIGGTRWVADQGSLDGRAAKRRFAWQLNLQALGGHVDTTGSIAFDAPNALRLNWDAADLRLERMRRESPHRGRLRSAGEMQADATRFAGTLSGGGTVDVDEGKLTRIPVLSDVLQFVDRRIPLLTLPEHDEAHCRFELRPGRVTLTEFNAASGPLAVGGSGDIYFDRRLDLSVHARPLSKIASWLGPIGHLMREIQDRVLECRVTGTIDAPRVQVRPLGVGLPGFGPKP